MPVRDLLNAASGASAPSDPYFYDVSLLLNGDGTNGAQNNTFLDSSTNNFTITRNGNTTQGSFSPYGNLWSNYFGGNGNYLTPASNSAFNFGTSGTFTIECWVYPIAAGGIFTIGNGAGYGNANLIYWSGTQFIFYQGNGSSANFSITSSSTYSPNQWYHVAAVRNSSNLVTLYVNGVSQGSGTNSTGVASATQPIINGLYDNNGLGNNGSTSYISNLRVTNTAVYTSAFTPSIVPLTAISGTILLTCQSNRFKDNSSNAFTISVGAGTPSVQRFSPFNPTAPYSTATIGGSGYFDGGSSYLSVASNAAFNFGSGAYTWEAWVYFNGLPGSGSAWNIFQEGTHTGGGNFIELAVSYNNSTTVIVQQNLYNNGYKYQPAITVNNSSLLNQWIHIAGYYNGTNAYVAVNGVPSTGVAYTGSDAPSGQTLYIGTYNAGSANLNGYMTDARVVKGTAVYGSSTFTPPTSPLTAISGTSLLENFTNAGIPDLAMQNDLQTVGSAQVSTAVAKYGTGSISTSAGNYLSAPQNPVYDLGGGDFTIEMWLYLNVTTDQTVIAKWWTGGQQWVLQFRAAGSDSITNQHWRFYANNGSTAATDFQESGTTSVATATWYHIALTRSGSSYKFFRNGNQVGTTYTNSSAITATTDPLTIGQFNNSSTAGNYLNGYIDDLRITKGFARYTTTFTPPTSALPTY